MEKSENLAGYGIHIDKSGRHALRSCLPLSNWTHLQAKFSSAGTQLFFRDTQLQVLAEKDDAVLSEKPALEVERSAVGRMELRDALLEGLFNPSSETLQWGRTFTEYTQLEDGRARAYFSDGSHEDCDLLVGADGPNSKVRQQFMPNLNRLDLGIQAIAGSLHSERREDDEITDGAYQRLAEQYCTIWERVDVYFLLGINTNRLKRSALYAVGLCRASGSCCTDK